MKKRKVDLKMKVITPTEKEVFNSLRLGGCTWCGGQGCQCYSRQLKNCYKEEEKRLTRVEYTEEEIREFQEVNKKTWEDIDEVLNSLFDV